MKLLAVAGLVAASLAPLAAQDVYKVGTAVRVLSRSASARALPSGELPWGKEPTITRFWNARSVAKDGFGSTHSS